MCYVTTVSCASSSLIKGKRNSNEKKYKIKKNVSPHVHHNYLLYTAQEVKKAKN